MASYDTSKRTTGQDVSREAREAGKEISDAVAAVKAAATGDGTLAQAGKELGEAATALGEAAVAAGDLVADTVKEKFDAAKRYFRTRLGYSLHDPDANQVIQPHKATPAEVTPWLETQVNLGRVREVDAAEAEAELKGPVIRDELSQ